MVAQNLSEIFGINPYLLAVILIWTIIWKAFALWKSARKGSKVWFVVLLVVNTISLLEILYIYVFSEIKLGDKSKARKKPKRN